MIQWCSCLRWSHIYNCVPWLTQHLPPANYIYFVRVDRVVNQSINQSIGQSTSWPSSCNVVYARLKLLKFYLLLVLGSVLADAFACVQPSTAFEHGGRSQNLALLDFSSVRTDTVNRGRSRSNVDGVCTSSTTFVRRRRRSHAVDGPRRRSTASVWTLPKSSNTSNFETVPRPRRLSTACERVRRRQREHYIIGVSGARRYVLILSPSIAVRPWTEPIPRLKYDFGT